MKKKWMKHEKTAVFDHKIKTFSHSSCWWAECYIKLRKRYETSIKSFTPQIQFIKKEKKKEWKKWI